MLPDHSTPSAMGAPREGSGSSGVSAGFGPGAATSETIALRPSATGAATS